MQVEKETISNLCADIERQREKLLATSLRLRPGLLGEVASNVPDELQRLAAGMMVLADDVRQAQRLAAAEARTELAVA